MIDPAYTFHRGPAWQRLCEPIQPPPHECQWCGADLAQTTHRPTCRVVLEVDELEIPAGLRRKKEAT